MFFKFHHLCGILLGEAHTISSFVFGQENGDGNTGGTKLSSNQSEAVSLAHKPHKRVYFQSSALKSAVHHMVLPKALIITGNITILAANCQSKL